MAIEIETVVTNTGKSSYSLPTARGKLVTLRAGESICLNYDIWTNVDRLSKKHLDRDSAKGKLKIETKVKTPYNTVTIDSKGDIGTSGKEEPVKAPAKPAPLKASEPPKAVAKMGAGGVTLVTANEKLVKGLGLRATDITQPEESVNMPREGFAATKVDTSGSIFDKNPAEHTTTQESPKSSSLFNNKQVTPVDTEAATQPAMTPSEESTAELPPEESNTELPPEESNTEMPPEAYVDQLFGTKEYNTLFDYLTKTWPDVKFTKAGIKRCNSFQELKVAFQF